MMAETAIRWRSIRDDPPPPGVSVWLTNGRAICMGKRVKVRRKGQDDIQWSFGTWLLHDADRWCGKEEFEAAVLAEGGRGLQLQPVR